MSVCPFLMNPLTRAHTTSVTRYNRAYECYEQCRWYDEGLDECSIVLIKDSLLAIAGRLWKDDAERHMTSKPSPKAKT